MEVQLAQMTIEEESIEVLDSHAEDPADITGLHALLEKTEKTLEFVSAKADALDAKMEAMLRGE
jgi:hypothetical protein